MVSPSAAPRRSLSVAPPPRRALPALNLQFLQLPGRTDFKALHAESARHLEQRGTPYFPAVRAGGHPHPHSSRLAAYIQQSSSLLAAAPKPHHQQPRPSAPERELRALISEMQNGVSSRSSCSFLLQRMLDLVRKSQSAAYQFFTFLNASRWKLVRKWAADSTSLRRPLIAILHSLLETAFIDVKREQIAKPASSTLLPEIQQQRRSTSQTREKSRQPLKNITNTVTLKDGGAKSSNKPNRTAHGGGGVGGGGGIFRDFVVAEEPPVLFKKTDLLALLSSRPLFEILTQHLTAGEPTVADRQQVQYFIQQLVSIALKFKNRELYDSLAKRLLQAKVFAPFLAQIQPENLQSCEFKAVARILELCACHQQGIEILSVSSELFSYQAHMDLVMRCVAVFLKADTAMEHVIFPAATVLLDLTASELCIERVATLMHSLDLLPIVVDGASRVLTEGGGGGSPRLRDLLIGIVLNLTCNVEDEAINKTLMDLEVVGVLCRILVDDRHDWPSNGAALALLQYSHVAMSDDGVYRELEKQNLLSLLQSYEALNPETKRHVVEAVALLRRVRAKRRSIQEILSERFFCEAA